MVRYSCRDSANITAGAGGTRRREEKMKRYMVVCKCEGEVWARFFDDAREADAHRMECDVCMDGYAQVYEYVADPESGMFEYRLAWE